MTITALSKHDHVDGDPARLQSVGTARTDVEVRVSTTARSSSAATS